MDLLRRPAYRRPSQTSTGPAMARPNAKPRRASSRQRAAAWREDARTRWQDKDGPPTAPSYVSVPIPDPAPGGPVSVMVRRPG